MASESTREGGLEVLPETRVRLKPPHKYRVLLHDDDFTTMEFVVEILVQIFGHPPDAATQIMFDVHRKGVGLAGTYPFEVAEAKAAKVTERARAQEFPFLVTLEEDDA